MNIELKPDDRTEIDPRGGYQLTSPNQTTINPPTLSPKNTTRFKITQKLVAKIEAIARARVNIARFIDNMDNIDKSQHLWELEDHQMALAMSVNASSQIEGEEIYASMIPLIPNVATKPEDGTPITPELSHRLSVVRDIYKAYLWALTSKHREPLSSDFIKELHYRMFADSTHCNAFAGKFKEEDIVITGARYHVKTLTYTKTSEAIDNLCNRVNTDFECNRVDQDKPLLTIVAEFLVDFLAIHPFQDGNGRTARLLSTYLLERIGYHFSYIYPIDAIVNERRGDYFRSLFSAQRNWYTEYEDLTQWIEFYIDAVFEQWQRAHRKIKYIRDIKQKDQKEV